MQTSLLAPLALTLALAHGGCAGIESFPGISVGVVGAAAMIGGGAASTHGDVLEGLGLSALGAALLVGAYTMLEDSVASLDLEDRRRDIDLALARGHGSFVSDLAQAIDLPASALPELGHALRRARPTLRAAMRHPLRGAAARSFVEAVRAAILDEAHLRPLFMRRVALVADGRPGLGGTAPP